MANTTCATEFDGMMRIGLAIASQQASLYLSGGDEAVSRRRIRSRVVDLQGCRQYDGRAVLL